MSACSRCNGSGTEPVVTESIGYIPGSKPEGLTIAPEVTERLAKAGKVIVDREDLAVAVNALANGGWNVVPDPQRDAVLKRLSDALGESR